MDIAILKERIEKKQTQIKKIEKRIAKWESKNNVEGYLKHEDWFIKASTKEEFVKEFAAQRNVSLEEADRWFEASLKDYYKDVEYELRWAKRDLEEANTTLNKYNNELLLYEAKTSQPKIATIMEFLSNWKADALDYYKHDAEIYNKAYLEYREATEKAAEHYQFVPRADYDKFKKVAASVDSIVIYNYNTQTNTVNWDKVNETLDKEVENKYYRLVDTITAKAGTIEDASHLSIGGKGELNGIVYGSKAKVYVETILAGGYNENVILESGRHGQCLHYRTICNEVK